MRVAAMNEGGHATLGPKDTPPPGFRGVRLEPARALPVPFCLNGLRPPPRTSDLVSVEAFPCSTSSAPPPFSPLVLAASQLHLLAL